MKKTLLTISALLLCVAMALTLYASPLPPDPDPEDPDEVEEVTEGDEYDEDDRQTRENPTIDDYDDEIDIPIPSFINVGANRIKLNGADWKALVAAINATQRSVVNIVQIGDSHIQADINSGTTRDLLQFDYGDAGRGIITPLKLSGTNEPRDYVFTSDRSWSALKVMKRPWTRTMGFTGTSITPASTESSFTIGTVTRDDYHPFSSFILFHKGKLDITSLTDDDGNSLSFHAIPSRDYTQVMLSEPETRVTVRFSCAGDLTLFGAYLSGDRPGVVYSAIGNNGATYATYNNIGTVGEGIAPLHPRLVIISLGCNEAFGNLDTQGFYRQIDKLVKNIKAACPDAQILLTTPMECQKSYYTTSTRTVKVPAKTSKRSKKGKKTRKSSRRMVTKKITERHKHYGTNNNILPLRNEILRYGRENGIAVYDWYEVAGGAGASKTWIDAGLFSGDRVHHSAKGYHLMGRLLYEALIDEFGRK